MTADDLHEVEIDIAPAGDHADVTITGELDTTSAPRVINLVHDLAAPPISRIDLHCDRVWFLDSAGVRALIVAHNEAARMDVDLAVTEASPTVLRILDVTGLTSTLVR